MGHWNHRVVRRTWKPGTEDEEVSYSIHETYYGLGDKEDRVSITLEPTAPYADSVEGLREVLEQMLRALNAPALDYETRKEI